MFERDGLEPRIVARSVEQHDGGGIAGEGPVGKGIYLNKAHFNGRHATDKRATGKRGRATCRRSDGREESVRTHRSSGLRLTSHIWRAGSTPHPFLTSPVARHTSHVPLYSRLRPLLFRLDPETAHRVTFAAARVGQRLAPTWLARTYGFESARLAQSLLGKTFENPVGLAAGMDKNARLTPLWSALGFGFVEVGSVTARPSKGNPRPRLFRLPEEGALVNRLGLNNDGAFAIGARLQALRRSRLVVGVNVAKTHDPRIVGEAALDDFRQTFERVAPVAAFVTLNVSCPNTREGKTFEEPRALDALLSVVMDVRRRRGVLTPVLVKLSPPLSDRVAFDSFYDEAVALAEQHGVAGFVATNTAPDRDGLAASAAQLAAVGAGGLSGAPLEARATHLVRYLYRRTNGQKVIVGVGGVRDAASAYRKLRAGASLVELYTGLVYEGPGLARTIKEGLLRLLDADGLGHVSEAVGADA